MVRATSWRTAGSAVTSVTTAMPPSPVATASAASRSMSATTTAAAPSCLKRRHRARPIPPPPPVMTVTAPCSSTLSQQPQPGLDEAHDRPRPALVARVRALAATMQHQVIAEDGRVLVIGQAQCPAELRRVGAEDVAHRIWFESFRGAPTARSLIVAALEHDAQAAQVEQRMTQFGNLPIEHRADAPPGKQHVAEVVVAVHHDRTRIVRYPGLQKPGQLGRVTRELSRRALHQPGPDLQFALQVNRRLATDPA